MLKSLVRRKSRETEREREREGGGEGERGRGKQVTRALCNVSRYRMLYVTKSAYRIERALRNP